MAQEITKLFAKRSERYPEPDEADVAHATARALLSTLPVIGGPAAELFSQVITPALSRRRDEWLKDLADAVDRLEAARGNFKVENLVSDERFLSAVIQTTRSAIATHEPDKREMLRNALLNSVASPSSIEGIEDLFFALIDSFSVSHIKVLEFIWKGVATLNEAGKWNPMDPYRYHDYRSAIGEVYPELKGQDGLISCLMADLRSKGLSTVVGPDDVFPKSSGITNMGIQFLNFILEPPKALLGPESSK